MKGIIMALERETENRPLFRKERVWIKEELISFF